MRDVPLMKPFYANPLPVHAGRIERVVYDEDNEEWPFVVWVAGEHFSLHAEVVEDLEPAVGDWLVVPKDGATWCFEDAVVLNERLFGLLYLTRDEATAAHAATAQELH